MVWPAIIAAGASLAGGLLDAHNAESARDEQMSMHRDNLRFQQEFAQRGIRWRVEDAQAAGIHPLFALGANLPTYTPTTYVPGEGTNLAASFSQAGQDIGRAIDATRTGKERVDARMQALALERGELENDLLRSQIAKTNAQLGPPMPAMNPGLNPDPGMKLSVTSDVPIDQKPMERTIPDAVKTWSEPGAIPDVGWVKTPTGVAPVPSKDAKDRIEDQLIPEAMWALRNQLAPNVPGWGEPPPRSMLPDGYNDWKWSYSKQEWQPSKNWFKGENRRREKLY